MLQQQSANAGTLGSSGFAGGQSSLQSQLGSNLGFANTMRMYGNQANAAQRTASNAGAITGLVQSGLNLYSQFPQQQQTAVTADDFNTTSSYDMMGRTTNGMLS